jgi:hypothetical protein
MKAELHEPGRACCGQRGTGSYRHLDSADVPRVGGRLGERTVQSAGQCRFVASQVACGSDRNGDGTARGSGPGEDAVPRRPWDAAAAVERAQLLCVVLGKTRPTGGQEANRWKWRRRSDSKGWLERPETHAPPKTSAARRKGPEMCIVCFRNETLTLIN